MEGKDQAQPTIKVQHQRLTTANEVVEEMK